MSLEFLKTLEKKHHVQVLDVFKAGDFGPLSIVANKEKSFIKHFKSSFYATVRPSPSQSNGVTLFKLNLNLSRNFYCLVEKDQERDLLIKQNAIQSFALRIPSAFRFFCGQLNQKKSTKADVNFTLVFIPDDYLRDLIESQCNSRQFHEDFLQRAFSKQRIFLNKYIEETNVLNRVFLEEYFSMKRTLSYASTDGSNIRNIPSVLQKALSSLKKSGSQKCLQSLSRLPENQVYELHSEVIRLPDGRHMQFKLSCHAKYHGTRECFTTKNFSKLTSEFVHYYTIDFRWS